MGEEEKAAADLPPPCIFAPPSAQNRKNMKKGVCRMKLKGCQRKIICMRSADSHLFDEAFFVLRDDAKETGEGDMLAEANRILDENLLRTVRRRAPAAPGRGVWLLIGAAGASLLWLAVLLFALL